MLLNTIPYFIFLLLCLIGYYTLFRRWQAWFLLIVSYGFYLSFDWRFGGLLFIQTLICYLTGRLLARIKSEQARKWCVAIVCLLSFGCLGCFKYLNFCLEAFQSLCGILHLKYLAPHLNILLPIGISFFTFQSVGYVIDVYRSKISAEHNFPVFALFVAFFPQLASGPIGRSYELLPQLKSEHGFSPESFETGATQILYGLFKKVVIADRLAGYVGMVYGDISYASSPSLLLAAIFFSIQIYCDFSGYTDIAIGSAKLFGIDLRKNFDFPYFAQSINDFWKRWHISLTSWFRDYLYIPLGGNRCSHLRWASNIIIVFLVSGLWHGANWTFIAWGGIHGVLQLVEVAIRGRKPSPYRHWWSQGLAILSTFVLVTIAWIFFRAPNITTAGNILKGIVCWHGALAFGASQVTFALNALLLLAFAGLECIIYRQRNNTTAISPYLRACRYAVILTAIALFGQTSNSFIYLQF